MIVTNNFPTNLNFQVLQPTAATEAEDGFNEVFIKLTADDQNIFYSFKEKLTILSGKFNAKLVDMPIPPGFKTLAGQSINSSEKPILMPFLVDINSGFLTGKEYEPHFCDEIHPLLAGTACANPLQPAANSTYFKTSTPVPTIRGNELLNRYVQAYNACNKEKELFYLPTITPNKTIQYIVFNDQNRLKEVLKKAAEGEKQGKKYIIGLNGFIIYVDQWDCSIFFDHFIFDKIEVGNDNLSISSTTAIHMEN